jgi:hypothetical protein
LDTDVKVLQECTQQTLVEEENKNAVVSEHCN